MQIILENGGGVYVFKGIEYGDKFDIIILYSGCDGSSTTRNNVQQLYQMKKWEELDEYIDLFKNDGCFRQQWCNGTNMREEIGDKRNGRYTYRDIAAEYKSVTIWNYLQNQEDGYEVYKDFSRSTTEIEVYNHGQRERELTESEVAEFGIPSQL